MKSKQKSKTLLLTASILSMTLTFTYGKETPMSLSSSNPAVNTWKPTITEEKKEKIQPFIAYFMEAQEAEMEGDDDFSQGFPWRSFRASIEALKTPEAAGWIIETLPEWIDGRDQETLALLSKKTGELATPRETKLLLEILNKSDISESSKGWGLFILENTKNEQSKEYLKEAVKWQKDQEIVEVIETNLNP